MPSADDQATLQAYMDGVDAMAKAAEAEWGVDRLPLLVDDDLRAKFYRQQERWRGVLEKAWSADFMTRTMLDDIASKAGAMQRGWAALSAAATEAGHRPIKPWVWEARLKDGTVAAIVQTNAEAGQVIAEGRHLAVYTLAEIANVIDALPGAITMAKIEFPGAKVLPPSGRAWVLDGDPIPFGGD